MTAGQYFLGPFHYDATAMRLSRGGEAIAMGRPALLILDLLIASKGAIVGKRQLIDAAWGDRAIEESNLSVQISKLRRVLGEERIRTIERVGYQLITSNVVTGRTSRVANAFPSICLMASGREDDTGALLVEISAALARFKTLRVIAASDDGAGTRRAGAELGADYVAMLSHRRGDPGASGLTVRLTDGPSGIVLWAEHFAAAGGRTIEQIASSIESEVQGNEFVRGARDNAPGAEAYALYLRGRRILNSSREADNRVAFGLFMAAIKLEPENPAYLAAATESIHHRLSVGWEALGPDDKRICHELAYRTLAVADGDAVAVALAGNALFTADEEDVGLTLCRRALAMNPTSQLVLACALHAERWGGSMEQSEAASRTAAELAPNDPGQRFALGGLATIASWRGDYTTALELGMRSLAFGPGYIGGHHSVIEGLIGLGRQEQAERHMARYLAVAPGVTILTLERGQHMADASRLAQRLESLRRAGMPER